MIKVIHFFNFSMQGCHTWLRGKFFMFACLNLRSGNFDLFKDGSILYCIYVAIMHIRYFGISISLHTVRGWL